jgi:hypothetical protein
MGILNPAGALTLAAIAVLLALYLLDRRRRVVPLGSLFLWERVPAAVLERRRFRPDALFLLQLALLLALIAGYLRPYLEDAAAPTSGAPLVLVLDVSASMQTRETGGTRFELARRRARALLDELASGDEAMLITAAERPHVAQRWTSDRAAVRARLEAIEPLDTPTRLAPALELALGEARARPGTRLAVLTDLPPEESGTAPAELAAFHYVQLGATGDNVAITALTVDQPPFQTATQTTVTAVVRNFAHAPRRATLEAWVGGDRWERRELALAPRATEHALLVRPPHAGEVVVSLLVDDALAVDDRAVGWIPAGEPLDLLLVSDSRELADAFGEIAAAVAGSRVEVVSRDRYKPHAVAGRRAALFDGVVPAELPAAVNALYVAPPPGNTVCPTSRAVDGAAVIDWEADHPVVRGLDALEAIEVGRTSALDVPDWGTPVVLAAARRAAFTLLVAGERDGRRIACLGTELAAPLTSSDKLPLLMLTLGALRWLAEPFAGGAIAVETGVPALAGRGPTAPVQGPAGGVGLHLAGDPAVLVADRTGTYRIGPPGGERLVLANLFDERESDVGREPAEELAAAVAAPQSEARARREIGWWVYLAGAALLASEWLFWMRRRPA